MTLMSPLQLGSVFALAKGILIAIVLAVMEIAFWQSLLIALVSSLLTMTGVIIAAKISADATRENRKMIRDIKKQVGANRRDTDDGLS